ncbi:hypothetical protein ESP131_16415 [Exiguobacterium sp. U13-1]|uniref:hypothetical protein n=1 Tax=Exiguobacterium sp. U13-1 TaxID=1849031 RepID=UPI000859379F|nr:hypothetical protein [Exiguobacterium sp. U13-1]AOT01783.1 hypothetical protein ESP131_16415 [Exiguobacterium sp. U13-1]
MKIVIDKKFLSHLPNLSVSIPVPQQRIQEVLAKQIEKIEDIQVLITPEEIEISDYVLIKKLGFSCKHRVDGRVIYFNVLKLLASH